MCPRKLEGLIPGIFLSVCMIAGCAGFNVVPGKSKGAVEQFDQDLITRGRKQFARCVGCHSMDPGKPFMLGPHLEGIVGRMSASVEGFEYSTDIQSRRFEWTEVRLDAWLIDPQDPVPDMCETFNGIFDPDARQALIAYLKNP